MQCCFIEFPSKFNFKNLTVLPDDSGAFIPRRGLTMVIGLNEFAVLAHFIEVATYHFFKKTDIGRPISC